MRLRKLCSGDAPRMLEWMTAPDINRYFRFDAQEITMESVLDYIAAAQEFGVNRHYAVADDSDSYLGTISLKNINTADKNAEYAISLIAAARGTGAALFATKSVLDIAFHELGLHKVYLNVFSDNERAIRFYEKMGFVKEGYFKKHVCIRGEYRDLCWYAYFNGQGVSI